MKYFIAKLLHQHFKDVSDNHIGTVQYKMWSFAPWDVGIQSI